LATQPHSTPAAKTEGAITHGSGPIPPKWETPKAAPEPVAWEPKPDLNPQDEKPPANVYADGMDIATEQRARSAWIEQKGVEEYHKETFEGDKADRPKFDKSALAGGGAYVSAGKQAQVTGVTPPTKRS